MSDAASAARATAPAGGASFGSVAAAELIKMRRTWLLPLALLGPLGVTLLGVILFLLRGEYLLAPFLKGAKSGWLVVADQMGMVHIFSIGLGAALLASMLADLEHRSDTWKQMFSLPLSRAGAYAVKLCWGAALLALSSALMSMGYAALMTWQRLGPLPWETLARAAWLPWLGVLPLFGFQLLISTLVRNQAAPLALGVVTPMFGMGLSALPAWLPWRLPTEAMMNAVSGGIAGVGGNASASLGVAVIAALAVAWTVAFATVGVTVLVRRDVR